MGLREANQNFSKAIKAIKAGKAIVLTKRGKPIATIRSTASVNSLCALAYVSHGFFALPWAVYTLYQHTKFDGSNIVCSMVKTRLEFCHIITRQTTASFHDRNKLRYSSVDL
jgi:hypothetical protein